LIDERDYQVGVDHGVLNVDGVVIPWSGLVSVDEAEIYTSELVSMFDGKPYANLQFGGTFQAQISAISFPDAAWAILGLVEVVPGLLLTNQQRATFDFSYRTMINDTDYKLHFVHDATLSPKKYQFDTSGRSAKPRESEWVLEAVPTVNGTYLPTSHVVVSSVTADPIALEDFEVLLYGDPDGAGVAEFPTQSEIIAAFA
jgi:hypothetical protein